MQRLTLVNGSVQSPGDALADSQVRMAGGGQQNQGKRVGSECDSFTNDGGVLRCCW
jgi:hypothetical protein